MTTREEVVVRAGFDNTTIAQGLRGTKAMIQEFATTAVSYLSGIFGAWQAVAFARGIVDWAKNISLVSERLNVGTTAAQQFSYAAKLTGVELDDVAASLDRLAKAKETATGGGPASIPMLAAFRQFGISLHDIQTMTPETLFDRIAQSVARTGANAAVTAAAMELFGRAGGKLIPLLAQFEAIKKRTPIITEDEIANLKLASEEMDTLATKAKIVGANILNSFFYVARALKTGQGIWAADMFKGGGGGFGGHGAGGDWGASAADNSDPTGAQAMLRQEQAQRWQTTLSRIAEIYRQMYDAGARGETKVNDLIARGGELRLQVALNPLMTSVQYQQTLVELAQNELDIKTAKAAADQETLELNRRLRDLYREQAGIEREARAHAAEGTWLTLEQLAGSRYTRSIEQQYGAGGRYDLSRGNTRFAREARELYRLTHGATAYDREYGTQSNVDWDIARIGTLRKSLSSGNVLPPDESLAAIVQHSQTTASAITDVRDQMRRDGIPVKIDSN